ncbi:maleylpyruvate isomerase N-terminal domain-containing protein [Amycolatopsis sp. NPDC051716]|uniref:maleylpyruvate isomerase N-terminal domain-containing protein n=1 Tax=Amycolatopsis sp. NPDC051716 TaxID=3155804 RepID=UPI00341943A4
MDLFSRTWAALRLAVASVPDAEFAKPSGCLGWLVRDLVCHLVIDAQDVLITLATPASSALTHDAITYWAVSSGPPTGDDPLSALIVRLAAAYEDPALLKFHLDDVGSAAGRAADLADPATRVSTLVANVPSAAGPPAEGLARTRVMLEKIAGAEFPRSFSDEDVLLVGTGRREPSDAEGEALGDLAARLPLVLG